MRYVTAGIVILAALGTAPLQAQSPTITTKAPSFMAGVGIGPGSFRQSCPNYCVGDRFWGWSGNVRAAVALGRQWYLGLEATTWRDTRRPENEEAIRQSMWLVGPVVYLYPTPNRRLNLKLSVGPLMYNQNDPDDEGDESDQDNYSTTAVGVSLGVGYDVPVADRLYISPFFTFVGSTGGDLTRGDGVPLSEEPNYSLLQFGISLVYR